MKTRSPLQGQKGSRNRKGRGGRKEEERPEGGNSARPKGEGGSVGGGITALLLKMYSRLEGQRGESSGGKVAWPNFSLTTLLSTGNGWDRSNPLMQRMIRRCASNVSLVLFFFFENCIRRNLGQSFSNLGGKGESRDEQCYFSDENSRRASLMRRASSTYSCFSLCLGLLFVEQQKKRRRRSLTHTKGEIRPELGHEAKT